MQGIYSHQKLNPKIIRVLGFKEISPYFWIKGEKFTNSQEFIVGRTGWQYCISIRGDSNKGLFKSVTEYISGKGTSLASLKGRWLIITYGEYPQQDNQTEIILISDRLGSHRIYYTYDRGLLIWSTEMSELLALKRQCAQKPMLDISALNGYLHFLHQPASKTLFQGVFILPPASTLTFSEGRPAIQKYWTPAFEPPIVSEKEAVSEIKSLLNQLSPSPISESRVKTGVLLSGGLDSTLLVSLCKKRDMDLVTYHVGYEGVEDERETARAVADHFKTDHREIILRPEDVNMLLGEVTRCLGFPTGNPSSLATYVVARQAKAEVARLMSGLGCDEIFAGHRKHIIARYRPVAPKMLSLIRKRFFPFSGKHSGYLKGRPEQVPHYQDLYTFFNHQQLNRLLFRKYISTEDGFYQYLHRDHFQEEQFLTDVYLWLADDLLPIVTTLVAHHGLWLDLPFCRDDIMACGARIPLRLKVKGNQGKWVLREACRDLVPDWVLKRGRKGFSLPIGQWLRGPLKELLDTYLHLDIVNRRGIFNPVEIQSMVKAHLDGKADLSLPLWGLITFEVWQRIFLDPQV